MDPYLDPRRRGRITSTDAAAILQLSPWRSALEVQARVLAELAGQDLVREDAAGPDIERGIHLEAGIRQWYGVRTGRRVTGGAFAAHPELDWLGASNDGFSAPIASADLGAAPDRQIEIKCPRRSEGWGDAGTDEIPDHYLAQVLVEMACHQLPVDVVLFAWGDISIYPIERDPEGEGELLVTLAEWHKRHIVERRPVPIDETAATGEQLARIFKRSIAPIKEASVEARRWAEQLREARELAARAEALELEARNHLCGEIGEAEGLICEPDNWKITWKSTKDVVKTNWQDVCEDAKVPREIVDRHTRTVAGSRRFLAKWK